MHLLSEYEMFAKFTFSTLSEASYVSRCNILFATV